MNTTTPTTAEFEEQVMAALTPAKAPRAPRGKAAAKPAAKREPKKPEPAALTPEQVAEQKQQDKLRAQLRKVVEKKAALAQEERDIVAAARKVNASWQKLAADLGMSPMGLRNRYLDLVDTDAK